MTKSRRTSFTNLHFLCLPLPGSSSLRTCPRRKSYVRFLRKICPFGSRACRFLRTAQGFVGLLTYTSRSRSLHDVQNMMFKYFHAEDPVHSLCRFCVLILPDQRIAAAFSPGHYSPSNDRFSPHAEMSLHGRQYFVNTAT